MLATAYEASEDGTTYTFTLRDGVQFHSGNTMTCRDAEYSFERGLVTAEWGVTANNQRARYYKVTKAGRAHLVAGTAQWVRYAETVTGILTTAVGPA